MIDAGEAPSPFTAATPVPGSPDRDDPLLGAWLERYVPADRRSPFASGEAGARRHARVAQFAQRYRSLQDTRSAPAVVNPALAGHGDPASSTFTPAASAVRAVSTMRHSLALARAAAATRAAPGSPDGGPLFVDTLAALEAEAWGAFLLAFLVVDLHDRRECGEIDAEQRALLALAAPLAQFATVRQAVMLAGELVECFGSATSDPDGLPRALRDALARPHGATAPDVLRADAWLSANLPSGLAAIMGRASACLRGLEEPRLVAAGRQATAALERAALWLESVQDGELLQAGSRRLALTFARALQLALLCEHAQWLIDRRGDRRGYAAALRFSRQPLDLIQETDPALDRLLLG